MGDRAALAFVVLAVLVGIGPTPVHAQSWDGTVDVRGGPLTVHPGESVTYEVRLSKEPTADGWWVRIHVDGEVRGFNGYNGLKTVPSFGWEFDRNNWDQWRSIRVYAADDAVPNTQVTFTHEVWDDNNDCPIHNVGPVTVRVATVSSPPPDDGGGNDGNDGNGGNDGNDGDDEKEGISGDDPETPTLAIDSVTVSEGGGSAVFRVTLSGQITATVSVAYGTSNGTASAGSDYTATHGNLVFLPGQRAQMIAVKLNDDTEVEGNETFTVSLSSPQNATLLNGAGTATIVDDDGTGQPSDLPALAIDDVTVTERGGSAVFAVSLRPESDDVVTVAYGTSDGTATAGSDYTAASGSLTFQPGETRKAITVRILDDDEEEGSELFTVRLSDARNAVLADPEGTATISDDESSALMPMDRETTEWLGHFGRTAATQAVDALDERFRCARDRRTGEGAPYHPSPHWRCTRSTIGVAQPATPLEGASVAQRDAPGWSVWGRGSYSRFDMQRDDAQILGGGVGNATVGVDLAAGQALLGLALSHSRSGGTVTLGDVAVEVASALTGFHPYLRVGVNDWLSLWGTVGIGTGGLTLTMDDGESQDTGVALRMASVGGLAQVLSPTYGHPLSVSVKADGLILAIDANASATFAAASMDASRARLVVEGAYEFVLGDGHSIAPFADIGGRIDGGGLGTGWGMEVGGGLRYAHPARHLTAELHTRALPVHATEGFRMWSLSGSVRYDPSAGSELGPYFTLSSSRGLVDGGREASGGIGIIARPLQVGGAIRGWDVDTELGYGFPVLGGSATGTPWTGASVSGGVPEYRLGYRLGFGSDLRLGLAGTLRDNGAETEPSDYQVTLTLSAS